MPESKNMGDNEYALLQFKKELDGSETFQTVHFYKMNEDGTYKNGTTIEQMLTVCIARLNSLNEKFQCRENSLAITKMEEACMWLNARTSDRIKRGVEGTHQA